LGSNESIIIINLIKIYGNIIQVKPIDEEDTLTLFKTKVPFSESSKANAEALIQTLKCISLTITYTAIYINIKILIIIILNYLKLFRKSKIN